MSIDLSTVRSRTGLISLALAESLWLAVLVALPLAMNVALMRTFEASKLGAVAPLAVLGLGALCAGALAGCFSGMRRLLATVPVLCFAALLATAVLATAASETPLVAFFGDYFRREGLLSWLVYGTLFFSLLMALRRRVQAERLVDVLLLATVIPCVYAVMQRYGYDFFVTHGLLVGTAGARPGGTMGNPVFLASLLLLVIPVTAARLLAMPPRPPVPAASPLLPGQAAHAALPLLRHLTLERGFCLLLLALQLFAVVLSQSRGPGLGLAIALAVFMLLAGGWRRSRLPIAIALAAALAVGAGLAALNLLPGLGQAAQGTALQRFVYSAADTNISSRVGIWQAGVNAFLHAPWWRQLLGYGPDAASFSYFQWIPAAVQRAEGYTETIDRLHCQLLETLLSFGIVGALAQIALFASLVWSAAQRLLPPAGPGGRGGFILLNLAGMALGAALVFTVSAGAGLAVIGAGVGLAGAWTVFIAWRALRRLKSQVDAPAIDSADGMLLAALASALIGSWVETLVGVPTIATYAVVAVYAALIVLVTRDAWRPPVTPPPAQPEAAAAAPPPARRGKGRKKSAAPPPAVAGDTARSTMAYPVMGWATALCLMIAVADFFPPLTGSRILAPSLVRLPLIIWPLGWVAACGLVLASIELWRGGGIATPVMRRFLSWCAAAAMLAVGGLLPLLVGLPADSLPTGLRTVGWLLGIPAIGWALCLAAAAALAMAYVELRRGGPDALRAMRRFFVWCAGPALLFTLGYFTVGDSLKEVAESGIADRVADLVELGYAACALMPLALAAALYFSAPRAQARGSHAAAAALAAGLVLAALTFFTVARDVAADTRLKLSGWAQNTGRPDMALGLSAGAYALVPSERRYAAAYAGRLVEAAAAYYPQLSSRPEVAAAMADRLKQSAGVLEDALASTPRDPWLVHAYANTAHLLASPAFERVVGAAERARYSALARKYFALAHQQFPGHPWFLRTWAKHEIDQGNRAGAYARLVEMENIDPANITAYPDWVNYARFGDDARAEAVAALRRGLSRFPKGSDEAASLLELLIDVARGANQPAQAVAAAQEATATDPERIRAWRHLADLYELTNQRDLALRNAEDAIARFSSRALAGNDATDFAALKAQVARLQGAAATARPPPAAK